jgi:glycosyltransferase involved in cell wall biosynthesis
LYISVVSPVYKAPKILPLLMVRLEKSLLEITNSFEVILVDDGCPRDSWSVIEELSKKYSFIKGIKLSRNFGQHYAINAGLDHAKGEWIVVMDCDLQDQPEDIAKLYNYAIQNDLDMVIAASKNRNIHLLKEIGSRLYKKIFDYFSSINLEDGIGNFGIYHRKVIKAILDMGDQIRVFPILVKWVGFRREILMVSRENRMEGKSSYTFWTLLKLAIEIGLAFSDKILRLGISGGLIIILGAIIYSGVIFTRYYFGEVKVPGYTSLLLTVLFMSGFLLTFMGILGLYMSKIFQKVKDRPLYIVSETTNYSLNQ